MTVARIKRNLVCLAGILCSVPLAGPISTPASALEFIDLDNRSILYFDASGGGHVGALRLGAALRESILMLRSRATRVNLWKRHHGDRA